MQSMPRHSPNGRPLPDDPNKRQTAPQRGRVSDRTMVDTVLVIAGQLAIVSARITGTTTMSQRKTTVPPTRKPSRSSRSGREGLIAKEKTEKQSAKKRSALDNRFHRTFFRSAAACLHEPQARRNASRRPSRASGRPHHGTGVD